MTETSRIADQLQRSFYGGAWHGPALMELLRDVDAATAAAHPLHDAHSIWDIVLHLNAWHMAVRRRMEGEAVELRGEKDWPPVSKFSDAEWQAALQKLETSHQSLYEATRVLDEARLKQSVPGRNHDIYFMLCGVAQHTTYHAGQIALLKRGT